MNLVDLVKDQLGATITHKAASMLGIGSDQARTATDAAVPAVLAGLTHMASTPEGAARLNEAVDSAEPGAPAAGGGGGILESLLGGRMFSGIAGALSKTLGLGSDAVGKLLGSIGTPLLGLLKHQKDSMGLDATGLSRLLTSQKQNIANAMPSGLGQALAGAAGLGGLSEWARGATAGVSGAAASTYERGREAYGEAAGAVGSGARSLGRAGATAGESAASWVVPVLAVCALGLAAGLWWRSSHRIAAPAGPAVNNSNTMTGAPHVNDEAARTAGATINGAASKVTDQLTDVTKSATDTLGQITDPASAEAALPKLRGLSDKLDSVKQMTASLPADVRSKIAPMVTDSHTALQTAAEKAEAIPGVGEKIKPVVDELLKKLTDITG